MVKYFQCGLRKNQIMKFPGRQPGKLFFFCTWSQVTLGEVSFSFSEYFINIFFCVLWLTGHYVTKTHILSSWHYVETIHALLVSQVIIIIDILFCFDWQDLTSHKVLNVSCSLFKKYPLGVVVERLVWRETDFMIFFVRERVSFVFLRTFSGDSRALCRDLTYISAGRLKTGSWLRVPQR